MFRASSKETNHAPNQRARTLAPARARKTKSCDRKTRAHLRARLVCARSGASRLPQRLAPEAPSRWFGCAKQLSPEALNVCDACRADTLGNRPPSRLLVNQPRAKDEWTGAQLRPMELWVLQARIECRTGPEQSTFRVASPLRWPLQLPVPQCTKYSGHFTDFYTDRFTTRAAPIDGAVIEG